MDDLIPVLIFAVVVVINVIKAVAGKKKPSSSSQPSKPTREPSSIEDFFEGLAEKFEPKPVEAPSWPDSRPRPDYIGEAVAFEEDRVEPAEEIIPPSPEPIVPICEDIPAFSGSATVGVLKSTTQSTPRIKSVRIPSSRMMKRGGVPSLDLRDKAKLREAMIANLIFSPPRAYDNSFDNSVVK